jgi:FkbM family methyltransferase
MWKNLLGGALLPSADPPLPKAIKDDIDKISDFSLSILTDFYVLAQRNVQDNFDYVRYSYDGIDRSRVIDTTVHANYLRLFCDHSGEFFATYQLLGDDKSRDLFRRLILFRMLGHTRCAIRDGVGWQHELELYRSADEYDTGESPVPMGGLLGRIHHFAGVPTQGGTVSLDCWSANVVHTALKKQYFLGRGELSICPRNGDFVIDAGACFGDSAVYFAKTVGKRGHVYAFDPVPAHETVIDLNVRQNNLQSHITIVPQAVADRTKTAMRQALPREPGNLVAQPGFSMRAAQDDAIPTTTIDAYMRSENVKRVDFIKMDIEGFELPALAGAEKTIAQFRPRLAISLYHRSEDFFEIPLWLNSRFPWYSFHLDHYTIHQEETVLFASPAV